jgi:hypothetical protein
MPEAPPVIKAILSVTRPMPFSPHILYFWLQNGAERWPYQMYSA